MSTLKVSALQHPSSATANITLNADGTVANAAGMGKVLQVVSARTSSNTATTGTARADTALTATITPSDAANTVLVIANFEYLTCNNSTSGATLDIYNGTSNSPVDAAKNGTGTDPGHNITYVDSPASVSAVTYTVRIRRTGASATATVSGWQTLTLIEIAS